VVGLWGAPGGKIPRARLDSYLTTLQGWGPRPFGSVKQLCPYACLGGRWAGATFLWIFAVFWCGSPELLGWPGLAGGFPLVCAAGPLVGPL
jgi:hypothetical protein